MQNENTPWWISNSGKVLGPVDHDEVRRKIRERHLSPDAYVCLAGTENWRRLSEIPEFLHEFGDAAPPPPPPDAGPAHPPKQKPSERYGWDPLAIAFLGLLFTPIWSGIMAAINGRRLGLDQPIWRPLSIGIGSQVLFIAADWVGVDPGIFWSELLFTIVPLLVLWSVDLDPQHAEHERQGEAPPKRWIIPVLAGSPLALLTILSWGGALFAPLEPAVVVQRFLDVPDAEEAGFYCTSNMDDFLKVIGELEEIAGNESAEDEPDVKLLDEYFGEYSDHDYRVDFRMEFPDTADLDPAVVLHGYFHLKWMDDQWKIHDMIVTANSASPDGMEPVSFLVIAKAALEEATRNPPVESPKTAFDRVGDVFHFFWKRPYLLFGLLMAVAGIVKAIEKR